MPSRRVKCGGARTLHSDHLHKESTRIRRLRLTLGPVRTNSSSFSLPCAPPSSIPHFLDPEARRSSCLFPDPLLTTPVTTTITLRRSFGRTPTIDTKRKHIEEEEPLVETPLAGKDQPTIHPTLPHTPTPEISPVNQVVTSLGSRPNSDGICNSDSESDFESLPPPLVNTIEPHLRSTCRWSPMAVNQSYDDDLIDDMTREYAQNLWLFGPSFATVQQKMSPLSEILSITHGEPKSIRSKVDATNFHKKAIAFRNSGKRTLAECKQKAIPSLLVKGMEDFVSASTIIQDICLFYYKLIQLGPNRVLLFNDIKHSFSEYIKDLNTFIVRYKDVKDFLLRRKLKHQHEGVFTEVEPFYKKLQRIYSSLIFLREKISNILFVKENFEVDIDVKTLQADVLRMIDRYFASENT
ncbi:hypothetical protein P9112_005472 [Eukaryota sp. TZLM1-RC]